MKVLCDFFLFAIGGGYKFWIGVLIKGRFLFLLGIDGSSTICVIQFLVAEEYQPMEVYKRIKAVYGDYTYSYR